MRCASPLPRQSRHVLVLQPERRRLLVRVRGSAAEGGVKVGEQLTAIGSPEARARPYSHRALLLRTIATAAAAEARIYSGFGDGAANTHGGERQRLLARQTAVSPTVTYSVQLLPVFAGVRRGIQRSAALPLCPLAFVAPRPRLQVDRPRATRARTCSPAWCVRAAVGE
jgi:hypothetical protein